MPAEHRRHLVDERELAAHQRALECAQLCRPPFHLPDHIHCMLDGAVEAAGVDGVEDRRVSAAHRIVQAFCSLRLRSRTTSGDMRPALRAQRRTGAADERLVDWK